MQGRSPIVLALALAVVLAGCVGGSGDGDGDAGTQSTPETTTVESTGPDGETYQASQNATYLNNTDYQREHVHDYWNNRTRVELVNEDIEISTFCCRRSLDSFSDASYGWGGTYFSLPNNTFVPEGTGTLEVEIDATAASVSGSNLVFEYSPAGWGGEWTTLDANDLAPAFELELAPTDADLPHARSTRWLFGLQAGSQTVLSGTVHVKITAVRLYDIEAWPEHADFWQGGHVNRLDIMNETVDWSIQSVGPTEWIGVTEEQAVIELPEGSIIPPETTAVVVRFSWELNDGLQQNYVTDVDLHFKLGDSSFRYAGGWCFEAEESDNSKIYVIPVDETQVDSPYADRSAWLMQIGTRTGINTDQASIGILGTIVESASGSATIDLQAFHEPPAWVQDALDENGRCFN